MKRKMRGRRCGPRKYRTRAAVEELAQFFHEEAEEVSSEEVSDFSLNPWCRNFI